MQSSSFRNNTFDISPKILNIAEKEELGELCKIYTLPLKNTVPFGIGILCIFFSCTILPFIFLTPPPPVEISITGIALLLTGCLMIFSLRMYPRWRVYLWQDGFLSEKGRTHQVFRWDQIESLHCLANAQHFTRCKISRRDGCKITLSSAFPEMLELLDRLFEAFAYQCASQELDIIPSRSISTFADIRLNRQGIGNAQETLSWQEIQSFSTKNGMVILRKKKEE